MTFASTELVNDLPRSRVRPDAGIDGLSPRTLLVARMLAGGLSESEVAHAFGRGRTVVERERKRFCDATGAFSRRDIVLACRRFGLEPV
ncbi:DNA-binding NarL/FixJ family response regulator [Methylorubrum rhodinum]|uniref:DNA-binding NarL/FixJ family response regulator n=1 Tax=Methylorubrum rhodinum TaxID=29428 RepID=A0A840ZQ36_9HYPH|nr:hypothetical protein [Methylorubrum rhodinum]MBB5758823.1 DNA-binding NarL/FixJ family response regulator [Methylorubrum rhodinum]